MAAYWRSKPPGPQTLAARCAVQAAYGERLQSFVTALLVRDFVKPSHRLSVPIDVLVRLFTEDVLHISKARCRDV